MTPIEQAREAQVARYRITGYDHGFEPAHGGAWVRYDDHVAALANSESVLRKRVADNYCSFCDVKFSGTTCPSCRGHISRPAEARLSPTPPVDGVGAEPCVKPLEWHKSHMPSWNDDWHTTTPFIYSVRCADENGWKWSAHGATGYAYSADAAKAAAQADYERRVLSAIASPEAEARLRERVAKAVKAERERIISFICEQASAMAEMAVSGLPENSRNREAMEAALTNMAHIIRAAAIAPTETAEARLAQAETERDDFKKQAREGRRAYEKLTKATDKTANRLAQADEPLGEIMDDPWAQVGFLKEKLKQAEGELELWKDRAMKLRLAQAEGGPAVTEAAQDVLTERRRQVEAEGWTPEHDDTHANGEIARAAGLYALVAGSDPTTYRNARDGYALNDHHAEAMKLWPWDWSWFKPTNRRRDLVKAGALILAEIERLDRTALHPQSAVGEEGKP
jgi:hypothetical protein